METRKHFERLGARQTPCDTGRKARALSMALAVGLAAALVAVPSFAFAADDAEVDSSDEAASVAAPEAQAESLANEKTKVIDGVTYKYKILKGTEEEARVGAGAYVVADFNFYGQGYGNPNLLSGSSIVIPGRIDGADVVSCEIGRNVLWEEELPRYDFDASKAASLKRLELGGFVTHSVNVSENDKLEELYLGLVQGAPDWFTVNGPLKSLDVSRCVSLRQLNVSIQSLAFLDVSSNAKLTYLDVAGNKLASIDVGKNGALEYLHVGYNPMPSLDVSKNVKLRNPY